MNYLDWLVVWVYILFVVGLAIRVARSQQDLTDYYLAGKKIKWWQSGASTMATQLSAVSFISAPAFVALKTGGGLKWLAYEFAVPLALVLVMAVIIPFFHRRHYISIYEYLEERFDSGTRSLISLLFQLGRGLATAVAVLAGGLILSTALSISTSSAIILLGAITLIYDVVGGIKVVILSDFFQMVIIVVGILICGGVALQIVDWEAGLASLGPNRLRILDLSHWGVSPEGAYGFWPMLFGGFVLYASYYGCDQSQVQRELTVGSVDNVRKSLMINALGRFPLVLLYCFMGIFVGAVFATPEAADRVASAMGTDATGVSQLLENDPDRMVPMFIFSFLPHGLIGFIFVAIMAALMSSLDSGLNSLSAVTVRDFYQRYVRKDADARHYLVASKFVTIFWGIFCLAGALILTRFGDATRQTTIVLINAIGSLLYGPILAAFLLGMLTKWASARAVKIGVVTGIAANVLLWLFTPISWLWWNVSGLLLTAAVAGLFSTVMETHAGRPSQFTERDPSSAGWRLAYKLVVGYFILILLISFLIQSLAH